jgi:hypothetical protein
MSSELVQTTEEEQIGVELIDAQVLASTSTSDLRTELARGLRLTADTLTRLGMVWAELERRGEDLAALRHGLARTLPLIAAGRLAAEAVVAFASRLSILRALDGVPLAEQRRLAAGEPIEVILPGDPKHTEQVSVQALPVNRLRLVFADGEILPPAEQRLRLRERRRAKGKTEAEYRYQPRYDRAAGTITVGRMTVQLADLLSALATGLEPLPDEEREYVQAKVRLTKDESARLLAAALRAFGLI